MAKKLTSPYEDDLGFDSAIKNEITSGWIVLYDGDEAGLHNETGRWNLFCTEHGSMFSETNKARAKKLMKASKEWCNVCKRRQQDRDRPMKAVVLDETQEARDREMRFWAKRAKNNPEKCQLFEQIYGVKPDGFWD